MKLQLAKQILAEFLKHRRVPLSSPQHICNSNNQCSRCEAQYLPKIANAINKNSAISFVLPAFPGKSPNQEKVLGYLPDMGEKLALRFLGELASKIKHIYPPGIKIILCSDGRVFSDVIGMQESHVTAYQNAIDNLILELGLSDIIDTFDLDQVYKTHNFDHMRRNLMTKYGEALSTLQKRVRNGASDNHNPTIEELEANRMYKGMTRFLFEDANYKTQTLSKTAIQKQARIKAYEVIRRSNAWSNLIEEYFPEAVRLSIHPQTCGAKKLGIQLINNESWMTPWYGVVLETQEGFRLIKRSDAEKLGAELVFNNNSQASHFKLINHNTQKAS